jgi:DNA-binding HxlR family transcriptional regulator
MNRSGKILEKMLRMGTTLPSSSSTALEAAVARVGDRWALLIVDALLRAPRRFKELESAFPGLAPNVLSARLRRLAENGLVVAEQYSERPPRYEYRVSQSGKELAGALRLLASWGARSGGEAEAHGDAPLAGGHPGEAPALPRHPSCGTPLEVRWYCPTCERLAEPSDPSGAGEEALTWL